MPAISLHAELAIADTYLANLVNYRTKAVAAPDRIERLVAGTRRAGLSGRIRRRSIISRRRADPARAISRRSAGLVRLVARDRRPTWRARPATGKTRRASITPWSCRDRRGIGRADAGVVMGRHHFQVRRADSWSSMSLARRRGSLTSCLARSAHGCGDCGPSRAPSGAAGTSLTIFAAPQCAQTKRPLPLFIETRSDRPSGARDRDGRRSRSR
jgi:hypothetical protein